MAPRNSYAGFDEYAVKVVRHTTRVLVRRGRLQEADREDLEQELMLDLLRRLPRFDPARATLRTFVSRVVRHRAARIVAASFTAKAVSRRGMLSLQDEVDDGSGVSVERGETLDPAEDCRRSRGPGAPGDTHDLRVDLDAVVADLPADMQELCSWLLHHTATEAARTTGTSRASIWRRMQPVRERFAAAGIDDYLPGGGHFPERVSK